MGSIVMLEPPNDSEDLSSPLDGENVLVPEKCAPALLKGVPEIAPRGGSKSHLVVRGGCLDTPRGRLVVWGGGSRPPRGSNDVVGGLF